MACIPGFLHDVFISYACADDVNADGLIGNFWTLLTHALKAEGLKMKEDDPAGVDVFLDRRRLEAGADLTEQVLTSARGSAIFVAFHSPAYVASSWCLQEAREFSGIYDPRWPKLHGRLFVVSLGKKGSPAGSPVEALRSRRFRRFYYVNADGRDFPFEPAPHAQPAQRNEDGYNLKEEATLLAREIAATLTEMRKEAPMPQVFLADTSAARREQAEDIKNWLVQQQALVLRVSPNDEDWEKQSRELIARADLFVDLHEPAPHEPGRRQAELAAELKKKRIRWVSRGELSPREAQPMMDEMTLIEETLESFKESLRSELTLPSERHKPPTASAPAGGAGRNSIAEAMVLVVGAETDLSLLETIESKLDEFGCGRDSLISKDVIEVPDTWNEELKDRLKNQPAVLVFVDGECSGAWADKRLRDLLMLLRDAAPRARAALCVFPPPKARRFRPRPSEVSRLEPAQLEKLRELF